MDYIKRSDAVGVLRNAQFEYTADEAVEFVLHIPAADVREVVRGKWNYISAFFVNEDFYPSRYKCSECGHYIDAGDDKNFCPNCGADMSHA